MRISHKIGRLALGLSWSWDLWWDTLKDGKKVYTLLGILLRDTSTSDKEWTGRGVNLIILFINIQIFWIKHERKHSKRN